MGSMGIWERGLWGYAVEDCIGMDVNGGGKHGERTMR